MTGLETLKRETFETITALEAMATMETMTTLGTMTGLDEIRKRTLNTLQEIKNIKEQVLDTNKVLEKILNAIREDIKSYEDELMNAKAELADIDLHTLDWHHKEPRKIKCKALEAKIEELWSKEKLVLSFFQEELIRA